jgi:colanic acid biosynthesis glycosyl transferase WcaI
MRVLMLTPYYAPDLGPAAPLFTMLSGELARLGHQVTVIAAVPHYPSGQVPAEYRGMRIRRSTEEGVLVVRVPVPSTRRSDLRQRLAQYLSYQVLATWVGLKLRFDVVLAANPALWVGLPFACLAVLQCKPAIFSVHDVYPDVGVRLGVFRHRAVIAAVARLERFCLDHAVAVRILSESFRPGLRGLGVPDDKMVLIHDWVDTDLIRPLPRQNDFARECGLTDQFVVLYAGNIGLSQGLEHVLVAARLLDDCPNLQFVFVGDGSGRERLKADAQQSGLKNVQFLPFQPRARLPEVLATADISLVVLQQGIGGGSLPSKTFSILASGRPVLASVDEGSETWELVQRAEAGLCVPPANPVRLADAILTLRQDEGLRQRLGQNGRAWAEQHHSPGAAAERFESLMQAAMCRKVALAKLSDSHLSEIWGDDWKEQQ